MGHTLRNDERALTKNKTKKKQKTKTKQKTITKKKHERGRRYLRTIQTFDFSNEFLF
jgi:hypothetical protein